ncbi:MAG: class I SAM-dependent methyltransferase [Pseudolabrys sp.]
MSDALPGFFQGTGMPDAAWWEALWPDPAAVLSASGLTDGANAIDLCAGDGWFTLPMAKRSRHVLAIDLDPAMLDLARQRLAADGIANCDFHAADAAAVRELSGEPASFVFLANVFHGVPDRTGLVGAIRDVLAPGGVLAVVNWHPRPREETVVLGQPRGPRTELRMSPQQTIAAVEAGVLSLLRVVDLPPYHYAALFQRTSS